MHVSGPKKAQKNPDAGTTNFVKNFQQKSFRDSKKATGSSSYTVWCCDIASINSAVFFRNEEGNIFFYSKSACWYFFGPKMALAVARAI